MCRVVGSVCPWGRAHLTLLRPKKIKKQRTLMDLAPSGKDSDKKLD